MYWFPLVSDTFAKHLIEVMIVRMKRTFVVITIIITVIILTVAHRLCIHRQWLLTCSLLKVYFKVAVCFRLFIFKFMKPLLVNDE